MHTEYELFKVDTSTLRKNAYWIWTV